MEFPYGQQQAQTTGTQKATILGAVATIAVLAAGLITLRDVLDVKILITIEAVLSVSIFLLIIYGLFGERIGKWRLRRSHEKRWHEAIRRNLGDLRTVVEHLGWFIGERKQTETGLSRVYGSLRNQNANFVGMQAFPSEEILHTSYYHLRTRVENYDGSIKEFRMLCSELSELVWVYLSLVKASVDMLRLLGPNRKAEMEKQMKKAGSGSAAEVGLWVSSDYDIDQATQDNYQVLRERLNALLEDYKKLATRIDQETGEHVLNYPSSIPAKI